jgi:hypothetical protein
MPFKTDKLAIESPFFDNRTKILPCQKQMIPIWYNQGSSITSIAKMLKVNKRNIQFILFPERKEKNLKDRKLRGGSKQYYNREYHNSAIRKYRRHKYNLLKETV